MLRWGVRLNEVAYGSGILEFVGEKLLKVSQSLSSDMKIGETVAIYAENSMRGALNQSNPLKSLGGWWLEDFFLIDSTH